MQLQAPRVFVVDDHPLLSSNLAQMLRAAGFAAEPFTNSYEALAKAAAYPPELLISEIMMPVISGLQLAKSVKLRHPNCKVILMSAQVTTKDLSVPPTIIITKPIRFHVLLSHIHELGMSVDTEGAAEGELGRTSF